MFHEWKSIDAYMINPHLQGLIYRFEVCNCGLYRASLGNSLLYTYSGQTNPGEWEVSWNYPTTCEEVRMEEALE